VQVHPSGLVNILVSLLAYFNRPPALNTSKCKQSEFSFSAIGQSRNHLDIYLGFASGEPEGLPYNCVWLKGLPKSCLFDRNYVAQWHSVKSKVATDILKWNNQHLSDKSFVFV